MLIKWLDPAPAPTLPGSASVRIKAQYRPLHKTDSDLRKADSAPLATSIPLVCILRNSAVHGT